MGAELIMAAGSAAGSFVGGKILGNDKKAPPGGGIPGLTSSKGGGKDGTEGSVVQVDPTIALDYFKKAATTQQEGYETGLSYFDTALKTAGNRITAGYQKANQTLMPLSYSSNQALNEQMRMLGLDPIQATAGYSESLRTGIDAAGITDAKMRQYALDLANQMDTATNYRDPTQRANAKAQILSNIKTGVTFLDPIRAKIAGIPDASDAQLEQTAIDATKNYWLASSPAHLRFTPKEWTDEYVKSTSSYADLYRQFSATRDTNRATAAETRKEYQSEYDTVSSYLDELTAMGNDFANKYTDEYDAGYTPEEIGSKVSQLPGYQFQLEQGSKGIERKAAAQGMVASANTQAALQEFGQGQAMSYYNNYLSQLSGITAQGAGATAQISTNQATEGSALGQLAQIYGQAQMDTAKQIAGYAAQSLVDQGNLFHQTAMFNAGLQFNAAENAKKDAKAQALGAPNAMNAMTNAGQLGLAQQQFQYQVAQSQNMGQGYLYGNGYWGNASAPQRDGDWDVYPGQPGAYN